jgi:hypothetical protein
MEKAQLATLNQIPKEKAWKMINKFREHYKGKKFPGAEHLSHGIWFPFDKLNDWVEDAKKEGCTGVRIYFATYLDDEKHPSRRLPNVVYNYRHRNTVVLVSTTTDANGVERDHYNLVSQDKFNDPFNKGELCPEECGEADS